MKRYFPSREDRENITVLDLIHHDLSNHELQELSEAENKCLDLLERYVRDEERGYVLLEACLAATDRACFVPEIPLILCLVRLERCIRYS